MASDIELGATDRFRDRPTPTLLTFRCSATSAMDRFRKSPIPTTSHTSRCANDVERSLYRRPRGPFGSIQRQGMSKTGQKLPVHPTTARENHRPTTSDHILVGDIHPSLLSSKFPSQERRFVHGSQRSFYPYGVKGRCESLKSAFGTELVQRTERLIEG